MSVLSIEMVKENDSPGRLFTASGLPPGPVLAASGCVHRWDMVSGLNWKMITLGSGMRNVGMNSISAPLINFPPIVGYSPLPTLRRVQPRESPRRLGLEVLLRAPMAAR